MVFENFMVASLLFKILEPLGESVLVDYTSKESLLLNIILSTLVYGSLNFCLYLSLSFYFSLYLSISF